MVLWNGVIVDETEFRGQEFLLAECGIKKIIPLGQGDIIAAWKETCEATYNVNARVEDAPSVFNCLTFASWMLKRLGLHVAPLLEVATCGEGVTIDDVLPGDLVFTNGVKAWYKDPDHGPIGHVGIVTLTGVAHATRRKRGEKDGVIEESLEEFLEFTGPLRVIRRLIAQPPYMTLACDSTKWLEKPPQTAAEVKEYVDRSRAWFDSQLVDT